MITTIPPLWRDADAYTQLTQDPRVATFWGHAPAYCYLAKIPLLLGEQWDRMRGQPPTPRVVESQPALTDSGIWILIAAQHLALALAVLRFITKISRRFWILLFLALIWASNALCYTFAHCLGSETLGMILIVLLAAQALRLVQLPAELAWRDWFVIAVILLLCFLSRDLNLVLIAFLPIAFLISWFWTRKSKPGRDLRHAAVAIALGIACLAVGNSLKNDWARKTKLHPHSRIGFTFLWRLNFLDNLSPEARDALLRKVAARTDSTQARQVIALIGQMQTEKADMSVGPFMQRAILLFDGPQWEELDRAMNKMAFAFLLPPTPEHLQATKTDLIHALTMPPTEITNYLFATTAYYFDHKADMTACANLITFRDTTPQQIRSIPTQHSYFRLWKGVSYSKAFVVWLLTLAIFVVIAKRRRTDLGPVIALGVAVTTVGLLICVTACVLHELEPRFALSMWQMLLLSLFLFLGKAAELFLPTEEGAVRRAAVRSEP